MTLAAIKTEFEKYFVIKDRWILDMIFATIVGNQIIDRDPLWLMIIGPSSGGKTTLIAPCVAIAKIFFVDDMTEKTLLSGYKVKGKEASLLRTIGSGMLAFSDFTSILAKDPVSRGSILTQLKLVYDGKVTKYTGLGVVPWQGKIGFIGAATPDVYNYLESSRSMGERFLYYWFDQPTNKEIMDKQTSLSLSSREITERMQDMYLLYYNEIREWFEKDPILLSMTEAQKARVNAATVFCVEGKATIHTDFKTGKPDAIPNISGVGRDGKIFDTLLHSLQVMACFEQQDRKLVVTDEMVEIVEKCAYSSINRERRKILEILVARDGVMTSSAIGASAGLGLDKDSVMKYLAPLHAVGIIAKKVGTGAHQWFIERADVLEFVRRVSPSVTDNTHVAATEEEVQPEAEQSLEEWAAQANHEEEPAA